MKNICRVCMKASTRSFTLYPLSIITLNKMENLTSIKMDYADKLPRYICQDCRINVHKLFNFREKIINSDTLLRKRYGMQKVSKLKPLKQQNSANVKIVDVADIMNNEIQIEEATSNSSQNSLQIVDENGMHNSDKQNDDNYFVKIVDITDIIITEPLTAETISSFPEEKIDNGVFKETEDFNSHESDEQETQPFDHCKNVVTKMGVCNMCGAIMKIRDLNHHLLKHLYGPQKCLKCGATTRNMKQHNLKKHSDKILIFKCQFCEKICKNAKALREHVQYHKDPDSRVILCSICGKTIVRKAIRKHIISHTGERPYKCNICQRGLTSSNALKIHKRQHTNEKPYICEYCGVSFRQNVLLVRHLKLKHVLDNTIKI